jgi:hypothetical protein
LLCLAVSALYFDSSRWNLFGNLQKIKAMNIFIILLSAHFITCKTTFKTPCQSEIYHVETIFYNLDKELAPIKSYREKIDWLIYYILEAGGTARAIIPQTEVIEIK